MLKIHTTNSFIITSGMPQKETPSEPSTLKCRPLHPHLVILQNDNSLARVTVSCGHLLGIFREGMTSGSPRTPSFLVYPLPVPFQGQEPTRSLSSPGSLGKEKHGVPVAAAGDFVPNRATRSQSAGQQARLPQLTSHPSETIPLSQLF